MHRCEVKLKIIIILKQKQITHKDWRLLLQFENMHAERWGRDPALERTSRPLFTPEKPGYREVRWLVLWKNMASSPYSYTEIEVILGSLMEERNRWEQTWCGKSTKHVLSLKTRVRGTADLANSRPPAWRLSWIQCKYFLLFLWRLIRARSSVPAVCAFSSCYRFILWNFEVAIHIA